MWTLTKDILAILIVIYLFSQVVLPSFIPGMEYFNLHKKKRPKVTETLDELDAEATAASEHINDVKSKVETTQGKVDEIKTKLK